MKNNFFVFIEIVFVLLFIYILQIGTFIWFAIDAFGEDVSLTICLTVMLTIFPTVLFVWCVYIFAAKIYVDEHGITKRLFGIKLKYYNWQEIDHIKFYGNSGYVTSISFYKKRKDNKFLYRFYKFERIFFSCNKKKITILNLYAPENIKQEIENH